MMAIRVPDLIPSFSTSVRPEYPAMAIGFQLSSTRDWDTGTHDKDDSVSSSRAKVGRQWHLVKE